MTKALDLAQRILDRYEDRMRYVQQDRRWWIYDDQTGVWTEEVASGAYAFARRVDGTSSKSTLEEALHELKVPLAARPEDFDPDPWLLVCGNVAVDLRTGDPVSLSGGLMATRRTAVPYRPGAVSAEWEDHLKVMCHGKEDLIDLLWLAVGASIVGEVHEHAFIFLRGDGRNGKGVFFRTLTEALGDFASEVSREVLTAREGAHTTSITDLKGLRMAVVEEVPIRGIQTARLKQLTGGDSISARRIARDNIRWKPSHTLWLAGNHWPELGRDQSFGLWERMVPVDLGKGVPTHKQDPDVERRLAAPGELEGVLAWAVRGCLEWQNRGRRLPKDVVLFDRDLYRTREDPIGEWAEECLELGPEKDKRASRGAVMDSLNDWWERRYGRKSVPPAPNEVYDWLRAHDCPDTTVSDPKTKKTTRGFKGARVVSSSSSRV